MAKQFFVNKAIDRRTEVRNSLCRNTSVGAEAPPLLLQVSQNSLTKWVATRQTVPYHCPMCRQRHEVIEWKRLRNVGSVVPSCTPMTRPLSRPPRTETDYFDLPYVRRAFRENGDQKHC